MAEYERLCAVISSINDILSSEYMEMPGWEPNYVLLDSRIRASRFNIIGTIIDYNIGNPSSITVDDGTGQVVVRSFDELPFTPTIGQAVLVVGRPRKYNEQFYITSEILRIVDDVSWIEHRKKHILLLKKHRMSLPIISEDDKKDMIKEDNNIIEEKTDKPELDNTKNDEPTDSEKIYNMIAELDKGDGAQVSLLLEKCDTMNIKNAEKAIRMMLEMGDIFEIKSGRVKIL
ncbi:MAG: hypothetical protein ACMXYL_03540 [Candidatus Woesearchaeota archaeon]